MKTKAIYRLLLSSTILLPAALTAQEKLTKEIDVEREIVPELRAASRMEVFPATVRPTLTAVTLTPGELTSAADYLPLALRYEPASAGAAAPLTPYRGYVDAGYFPTADFGVAAGYAPVATENTSLNIWANINRRSYKDRYKLDPDRWHSPFNYKTIDIAAGVGFSHRFSPKGRLDLATDFGFSSFNKALVHFVDVSTHEDPSQEILRWKLKALWNGSADNGLLYSIGAYGGIFNYCKALPKGVSWVNDWWYPEGDEPQHQTTFGARLGASLPITGSSRFGLGITTDWQHLRQIGRIHYQDQYPWISWNIAPETFSVSSFNPYYSFSKGNLDIHAGLRLDFITGKSDDILYYDSNTNRHYYLDTDPETYIQHKIFVKDETSTRFRLAPDVNIAYNPMAAFGVWLKTTGGGSLNTLESLYNVSRYIIPWMVRKPADVKVDGEFGLRVGPVKGIALEGGVEYANVHNWLMPVDHRELQFGRREMEGVNLHSFKAFVGITASWREYVSLTARFDCRLGDETANYWYTWRDDTRSVLTASLKVRPFSPLEITAGYTGYFKRRYGDIADLSAGASYRISAPLRVFAKFDNILNRRQYDVIGFQMPGFNGLFGVEYKF